MSKLITAFFMLFNITNSYGSFGIDGNVSCLISLGAPRLDEHTVIMSKSTKEEEQIFLVTKDRIVKFKLDGNPTKKLAEGAKGSHIGEDYSVLNMEPFNNLVKVKSPATGKDHFVNISGYPMGVNNYRIIAESFGVGTYNTLSKLENYKEVKTSDYMDKSIIENLENLTISYIEEQSELLENKISDLRDRLKKSEERHKEFPTDKRAYFIRRDLGFEPSKFNSHIIKLATEKLNALSKCDKIKSRVNIESLVDKEKTAINNLISFIPESEQTPIKGTGTSKK